MKKLFHILFILSTLSLGAQEIPVDSIKVMPAGADSLIKVDSTFTAPAAVQQDSDIDTVIYYEAAVIDNDLTARKTYFSGNASVKYKDIVLKAGKITLNWDETLITAEPIADTTWVKTDSAGTDSTIKITLTGEPELDEGGSKITGQKMDYNYKTEKGRVIKGRSEVEGGKYVGTQIKRVDANTFNISNSSYTTCDLDSNPHFRFEARRMKMIPNDKVVAKPIVAKLGNIPVFMLPFAVFPHKTGRHSGLLIPRYGESYQEGRFLRELGYYWAPNDYFDAKGTVDYFEKSGFLFRAGANYVVRYSLHGSIDGSLTRKDFRTGGKERRWDIRVDHNQELSPTSRISVDGNFVSDKDFYKSYSTNLETRLNRELRSNFTWSKSWKKFSLSLNMSHSHDLQEDLQSYTLPQLSLRRGQSQIFSQKTKGGGRKQTRWYHSLTFNYSSSLSNRAQQSNQFVRKDTSYVDANGQLVNTTVIADTVKQWDKNSQIAHDIGLALSSPKKFFGWLSLNQNLNVSEDWFNETLHYSYNPDTEQIESEKVGGFAARHTFTYGASANTKAYGVFPVRIGDINSFRHVMTPSLNFSWAPDFTGKEWGYYQYVQTPDGVVKRDRFGGSPGIGGGAIGFSLGNLFQMRKGEGEKAKKIDMFNVNFNTSYNLKAVGKKLSDLSSSWTANPMRTMSLSAGTSHSFYQYDFATGRETTNYVWQSGDLPRLTNIRFDLRFRLEGKGDGKQQPRDVSDRNLPQSYEEQQLLERQEDMSILEEDVLDKGDRFESERAISNLSIPWRMNVGLSFNLNRSNPNNETKRYYMDISGAEVSLTHHWRIGYSAHYDLAEMEISHHRFTIYRDLHCWEANIDWVPSGPGRRVYVKVSIKAPMFRDIKIERRGGQSSVLGY